MSNDSDLRFRRRIVTHLRAMAVEMMSEYRLDVRQQYYDVIKQAATTAGINSLELEMIFRDARMYLAPELRKLGGKRA